jgi:hypothetical protein
MEAARAFMEVQQEALLAAAGAEDEPGDDDGDEDDEPTPDPKETLKPAFEQAVSEAKGRRAARRALVQTAAGEVPVPPAQGAPS